MTEEAKMQIRKWMNDSLKEILLKDEYPIGIITALTPDKADNFGLHIPTHINPDTVMMAMELMAQVHFHNKAPDGA